MPVSKTAQPKRHMLVSALRKSIRLGEYSPGDMIESEARLAKQFSLSRGTVRNALSALERENLLVRVPGCGTFVRENQPQKAKVGNIVTIVDSSSGFANNFCMLEILEGLRGIASEVGLLEQLNIKFIQFDTMEQTISRINSAVEGADGVLAVSFKSDFSEAVGRANINSIPCVNFFKGAKQSQINQIYVDQAEGVSKAVNYLLQCGHRRIGLVVVPQTSYGGNVTEKRILGYQDTLGKAGIEFCSSLVVQAALGGFELEHGVLHMLDRNKDCTALIVGGGMLTHPTLQAIRLSGRKIPDDLSVIAFDDTYETQTFTPPLSVMKQPLAEGVRIAFQRLVGMVRGIAPETTVNVPLSPELVIRESCAPVCVD